MCKVPWPFVYDVGRAHGHAKSMVTPCAKQTPHSRMTVTKPGSGKVWGKVENLSLQNGGDAFGCGPPPTIRPERR